MILGVGLTQWGQFAQGLIGDWKGSFLVAQCAGSKLELVLEGRLQFPNPAPPGEGFRRLGLVREIAHHACGGKIGGVKSQSDAQAEDCAANIAFFSKYFCLIECPSLLKFTIPRDTQPHTSGNGNGKGNTHDDPKLAG